jgi:diguanylate cyclase (GGDEF)-like protein/PAS domain S-box-containing protein
MKDNLPSKARILVVEDESIVALDIKQRLESLGYTVLDIAAQGEHAVQKADSLRPDLILMDIKLKGKMDGIQAAEIIRSKLNLPIIFLTAFADEPTLQRARLTESFGYILKPFEERELSIQIEMALYKHKMECKLRESENRLRTIFTSVLDGLILLDHQGKISDVNPAGCAMFGYTHEEILSSGIGPLLAPENKDKILQHLEQIGGFKNVLHELKMRHKNGSEIWVEMSLAPIVVDEQPLAVGVLRDITSRKQISEALRESEERYSLSVQGANDGLWDWNMKTGVVYFSPRWQEMLGVSENEIGNTMEDWYRLIHPQDLEKFKLDLGNHLAGLSVHFQSEYRIKLQNGNYRWMLTRGVAVRDQDEVPYRMAGSQSDINERKLAEQQLQHDAFHDMLTGLPNRALLLDRLEHTMERAKRNGQASFAVLFLDMDRFKVINDSLGHHTGDQLLIDLSQRLSRILRPSETIARLGGDEFVVLLEDLKSPQDAELVAERIQEELRQPFILGGQSVFISASIGIVTGSNSYNRPEEFLRDADIAMYRAKADGKARFALFEPKLRERAVNRLELEADLRFALARQELKVFYQPVFSLETNKVVSFEALLRWFHPTRGLILPTEFIPVAEETGLILPIGRWVLAEACRQLHQWQIDYPNTPPFSISVNISGRQFVQPGFPELVEQTLKETNLDPHCLKLEITESLFMGDSKSVILTLNRLRALGVELLIDDFGTGFSSLGYVQHFPINAIKIDKSFVHQMDEPGNHSEIARTIVQLANELGLGTVAEGIETSGQLEQLRKMDCESGQGWLFSKALSQESIEAYLKSTVSPSIHQTT